MRVALVAGSNRLYMPYVSHYEAVLTDYGADYDLINWDRLHIEDDRELTYRDHKHSIRRNFFDYVNFSRFAVSKLLKYEYGKVIIFGIESSFFLRQIITDCYSNRCVLDIRDDHRIRRFSNIGKMVSISCFAALSSPGYREWLPSSDKYVINHNTAANSLNDLAGVDANWSNKRRIVIANIGSIAEARVQTDLVEALKNREHIVVRFHGEGAASDKVKERAARQRITNVEFTGRYTREEEEPLYLGADMINVLLYNDSVNNRTALPNRLYNAAMYGKPLLALEGTFLSRVIREYSLGLVVNSLKGLEESIWHYLSSFDVQRYEDGRARFFNKVIMDNTAFRERLREFVEQ